MQQSFLNWLSEMVVYVVECICEDSCHNHLDNDQVPSCGNTCMFFGDNSKDHGLIYGNRRNWVKVDPFVTGI
ncbi:hypothetical protein LguiA_003603 [Lonicera macranthoides]